MTDFLAMLADSGLVTIGDDNGSARPSFVRDVYNAVKQGDTVIVFAHEADDDVIATATELAETADATVVMQSHETKRKGKNKGDHYSARDLEMAIDRRNGLNPSAPGDTWGNVTVAGYIKNESETVIGFAVR